MGRSSLAGIGGKTPPVKLIFNVNVVLDVCATDGATPTPSHAGRRPAGSAFPIRFRGHENPDDGVGAARAFPGENWFGHRRSWDGLDAVPT